MAKPATLDAVYKAATAATLRFYGRNSVSNCPLVPLLAPFVEQAHNHQQNTWTAYRPLATRRLAVLLFKDQCDAKHV